MSDMKNLADLKPDKRNARKHNPRNIGMIADAIREIGVSRSGVIDEDGNILAGNGTYDALSEAYCDVIVTRFHNLFPEESITLNGQAIEWQETVNAD